MACSANKGFTYCLKSSHFQKFLNFQEPELPVPRTCAGAGTGSGGQDKPVPLGKHCCFDEELLILSKNTLFITKKCTQHFLASPLTFPAPQLGASPHQNLPESLGWGCGGWLGWSWMHDCSSVWVFVKSRWCPNSPLFMRKLRFIILEV